MTSERIAPALLVLGLLGCGNEGEDGATGGTKGAESSGASGGSTSGGSASDGGTGTATGGGALGGNGSFQLPPANAAFDYQIGGAYEPPDGVLIVSRDREAEPAPGLYNICYVNGFQVQPGEKDFWLNDHPDLLLRDTGGELVIDPDWDEYLLDTSTDEKRTALLTIVGGWIAGCAAAGFDATEIDNLDSYSRSSGLLSVDDNAAFMKELSRVAHENGLAAGQKNSTELLDRREEIGADFAVAEECNRWNECEDYQAAYGDRVFVIEYREEDFSAGCTNHPELSIVLRDLDVTTPGSGTYVFDGC